MSVPGRSRSARKAKRMSGTRRGSATMIFAPFRCAASMRFASTGWVSLVFDPMTKRTSLSSISRSELVIAPDPKMVARLATVGACQSRAQWSTLFVPTAARRNFWKR